MWSRRRCGIRLSGAGCGMNDYGTIKSRSSHAMRSCSERSARLLRQNVAVSPTRPQSGKRLRRKKAKVSPRAIVIYEDVRRRKGGMAVARVIGGTCQGCRITVPEAIRKRAFGTEILAQCPNCDRILSLG